MDWGYKTGEKRERKRESELSTSMHLCFPVVGTM